MSTKTKKPTETKANGREPRRVLLSAGDAIRLNVLRAEAEQANARLQLAVQAVLKEAGAADGAGWWLDVGEKDVALVEVLPDER